MAKARDIKRRIRSIDNTRKITKTMEMVATSKLKRAQDRVVAARPFDDVLRQVIAQVRAGLDADASYPVLRTEPLGRPVGVLVVTSNRGLAGAFNANLVKVARELIRGLEAEGHDVELHVIGKKGASMLRYQGYAPTRTVADLPDRPGYMEAADVAAPLIDGFIEGRFDEVHLVYSLFRSAVEQRPVASRLLPLPEPEPADEAAGTGNRLPIYAFLPSPAAILSEVLPLYLRYGVYRAVIESAASEHGARRTAMKNATDNAGEMIRSLTRTYNRARQAQITQEIAELVGGAEALKG